MHYHPKAEIMFSGHFVDSSSKGHFGIILDPHTRQDFPVIFTTNGNCTRSQSFFFLILHTFSVFFSNMHKSNFFPTSDKTCTLPIEWCQWIHYKVCNNFHSSNQITILLELPLSTPKIPFQLSRIINEFIQFR